MKVKYLVRVLMLAAMMTLVPVQVLAEDTQVQTMYLEGESILSESELLAESPISTFAIGGPSLAEGNYANWFERLSNMPDYATNLYSWLESNIDADGALVDVSKGELVRNNYVHTVEVITGTKVIELAEGDIVQNKVGEALSAIMSENFQERFPYIAATYHAFDREHPEVFWLSGSSLVNTNISCGYSYTTTSCTINYTQNVLFALQTKDFDIRDNVYTDAATVALAIKERDESIANILANCTANSLYGKVKYLTNWLTKNNCYNSSADLSNIDNSCHESISALKGSVGEVGPVCEGYAKALKVLCDALNIPCTLVSGVADNGSHTEGHMWTYIQMEDGKWYAVDATWCDPVVAGNTAANSGYENDNYLLIGANTVNSGVKFEDSHIVYNTVSSNGLAFINGPVLADEAYEPVTDSTEPDEEPMQGIQAAEDGNYYFYTDGVVDTTVDGLIRYDAWDAYVYFEDGKWVTDKVLYADYNGGKFLVDGGYIATAVSGLHQDPANTDVWYFLSAGQVQGHVTNVVIYDGAAFYIENGIKANDYDGFVDYNGGTFLVAGGQLQLEVTTLAHNDTDNQWYYIVNGQVQKEVTSLVMYDGAWFYVVNGVWDNHFEGIVDYSGGKFYVANGMTQTAVNGLQYNGADDTWYFIGGGQVQTQYTGEVEYNGAMFNVVNGVVQF